MEEREISELAPMVPEVPTTNWANYLGVKNVQYIKMGHAPRIQAMEPNNGDHENTVRETEKEFATDLQLLMTETTNDPKLLKTLVCLKRKQYDNTPEEYNQYKRKLSTKYGLVFFEKSMSPPINGPPLHTPTQGTPRHQQDDDGGKTLLVAEALRSDSKKLRQVHTV